jgi:voltage-gated sodium channel
MYSRERVGEWIESSRIQRIIMTLILINAVTLGLETSGTLMARYGGNPATDRPGGPGVFVLEMLVKLYAQGLHFFRRSLESL